MPASSRQRRPKSPPNRMPVRPAGAADAAKSTMQNVPTMPPMPWTMKASRLSSTLKRDLMLIRNATTPAASSPTQSAPIELTAFADGVMPTRPAIAPVMTPNDVTWPSRIFSMMAKPIMPALPASSVLRMTNWVKKVAPRAQLPLKPNQPNHRMPPPRRTIGTLCGRSMRLRRAPSTNASARAATPAFMCTAVPPAKSWMPILFSRKPPLASSVSALNTQWATGK